MDVEKIEEKWSTYEKLCRRLSDDNLNRLLDALGERLIVCLSLIHI